MTTTFDLAIARLAGEQHLVFSREQAVARGATPRMIERRLRNGAWERIGGDVYRVAGAPTSLLQSLQAACVSLPSAVVSHESAAQLQGLPLVATTKPTVTVPPGGTYRTPLARVFRTVVAIPDEQVVEIEGLPVTDPSRTLIDLAGRLRPRRFERLADDLLAAGTVTLPALRTTFDAVARRGRPGISQVRELLEDRDDGYCPPASELEARLLEVIERAGLPAPQVQFEPPWEGVTGRVDCAYPDARLIIEVDGRRWHAREADFDRDRARDAEALLAGWRVLRFSWQQVTGEPDRVASVIRRALAQAA